MKNVFDFRQHDTSVYSSGCLKDDPGWLLYSNVTLVGVINIVIQLNFPDLWEKNFQPALEVSGREAGRGEKGKVIIGYPNHQMKIVLLGAIEKGL